MNPESVYIIMNMLTTQIYYCKYPSSKLFCLKIIEAILPFVKKEWIIETVIPFYVNQLEDRNQVI